MTTTYHIHLQVTVDLPALSKEEIEDHREFLRDKKGKAFTFSAQAARELEKE